METTRKKVTFNPDVKIHHMRVWVHAYRQSRKSNWEQQVVDSFRFKQRIKTTELLLKNALLNKLKKM